MNFSGLLLNILCQHPILFKSDTSSQRGLQRSEWFANYGRPLMGGRCCCATIAKLCLFAIALVFFIGHGLPSAAQFTSVSNDVARPIPGVGHDYLRLLSETVNPANGSVNINIQLPSPKARGLTLPVSLTYNSGSVHRFASGAAGGGQMIKDSSSISTSGWGDSLPYTSATFLTFGLNAPTSNDTCQFSSSYVFCDPAGQSHMLGLAGISYLQVQGENSASVSPDICDQFGSASILGGDGSVTAHALAICNGVPGVGEPISCFYGGFPFTVTDEHNNLYNFPWPQSSVGPINAFFFPSTIEDRNGNITSFSVTPDPNNVFPASEQVTDSLGRTIVSASHQPGTALNSTGQTSYVVNQLTYTVSYETISAQLPRSRSCGKVGNAGGVFQAGEACVFAIALIACRQREL